MQVIQIIGVLFLLLSCTAEAEQLSFSKDEQGEHIFFAYQWRDYEQQLHSLNFALSKQAIFTRFRDFRAFKEKFAESYIQRRIRQTLAREPIPDVQVRFERKDGTFKANIRGREQSKVDQAYKQLSQLEEQYFDEYLARNYYQRFISADGRQGIKPNHLDIARQSVEDLKPMKPLILDQVSIRNIRMVTNYVLAFVQSIPYSALESRLTSSGKGFNTPLTLLYENQGDCDSKMTLTAALLRSLMPRLDMVLVYLDQHALLGINVPPEPGEMTIEQDKITFVLAEPTGPALYPLGQIAPMSEQAILHNLYQTELFID